MSVPQESLNDILSGKEPAAEVVPVAETPAPTGETKAAPPAATGTESSEKSAPVRGEDGKFKAADAPSANAQNAKAAETPQQPRADVAAIIDERRKRQAAEARLREIEAGNSKGAAKPSVLEDEDAAFNSRISEGTRGIREQNYKLSVKLARMSHTDYAGAEQAFADAAQNDDRLIEALKGSDDPGEYIYIVGLQIKELSDVGGDFTKYRDKITTESRAQIGERDTRIKALEAEVAALKQQKTDLETLPRSLNSKASGAAPAAGSEDPEDIKSIARFGNQKR